jgi:interleukin-1 receptor-associated kinase 4
MSVVDMMRCLKTGGLPPLVPYQHLLTWTDDFSPENLLGEGAFGLVYKATVPDMGNLAVKMLKDGLEMPMGCATETLNERMQREINFLSNFHHSNIIKLLGYCDAGVVSSGSKVCLVYQLGALGALDGHFEDDEKARQLTWERRLQVALGISSAISFLHEPCSTGEPQALHRDVKSSNIVLDEDYQPKLIDCGLSKFVPKNNAGPGGAVTVTGRAFGSPGYQCPHYLRTSRYNENSEIFSFGLVLCELLAGRPQGACMKGSDGVATGKECFFEDEIDDPDKPLAPDVRIANWPKGLVDGWVQLCKLCLAQHNKRIGSMREVQEILSNLYKQYMNPVPIQTDGKFALLM